MVNTRMLVTHVTSEKSLMSRWARPLNQHIVAALYCRKSDKFSSLNLGELTPCFEDIAILGTIHVASIAIALYRLKRLCSEEKEVVENPCAIVLRLVLAAVMVFATFGTSQVLLAGGHYAPFEMVSVALQFLTWTLVTGIFVLEATYGYVDTKSHAVTFGWVLLCAGYTMKLHSMTVGSLSQKLN